MPVSNQKAPFKKSPQFTRDSFLRPPDWRWQQAKSIVQAQLTGNTYIAQIEPLVLYAVRLQKACKDKHTRQFIKNKLPDAWHVITLGQMDNSSQLRAQVQACIIYGLDDKATAQKLKWISALQVNLYRDLFFDLSGVQGISAWFQQLLLEPARQGRSMNLFRARALAHYHSLQAALHSLRFGNSGKSAKQAMDIMWRDARNKGIFDYMAQNLNVPIQMYVQSMQQAIKSRQDQAFLLASKDNATDSQVLIAAANSIADSVRGFTQAQAQLNSDAQKIGVDTSITFIKHMLQQKQPKA